MSGFELDQEETLVQQNTLAQQEKTGRSGRFENCVGY